MATHTRQPDRWDMEADLIAVGSSTGGLTAAIMGHDLGLNTVVLESADVLGGGTALSGGVIWVPYNHHMLDLGMTDSRDEALSYIRGISFGHHDEEQVAAYLDNGPEMVRYIEEHTPLRMWVEPHPNRSDYLADIPGGKSGGRKIGPDIPIMSPILAEAEHQYPIVAKVRGDTVRRLIGPRPPWAQGRGLVGSLVLACAQRGVNILTETRARELIVDNGRVIGVRAERDGRDFFVRGKRGILLATGGFEWNDEMNRQFIHSPEMHAVTPPSNRGDGQIMGMELGAATALMDHAVFQSGVHIPGEEVEGNAAYRPFLHGYPGNIMVNRHGRRCCNECFYPDIGRAFRDYDRCTGQYTNAPLFWIADQAFRDRIPVVHLHRGTEMADWLQRADTLPELAEKLGIPPDNFVEAVERFNQFARDGRDPDFHRGESTFEFHWGELAYPDQKPNNVLGPVEKPPFYGLQVEFVSLGNLGGLVVNGDAQVVDVRSDVIPGLYGTSNATALLSMGYGYESGACQGKSMIFGYIAARHMAKAAT